MNSRRRALYAGLALSFAVAVGYGLLWRAGAKEMQRAIADWAAAQRASGVYVDYGSIRVVGFPVMLRGLVLDASIGDAAGRTWRANTLRIDARLLSPRSLIFSAPKGEAVYLGDAGRWRIDAPSGRVRLTSLSKGRWALDVSASGAAAMRADENASAGISRLVVVLDGKADPERLAAHFEFDDVSARLGNAKAAIEKITADVELQKATALARGAEAWRGAGGALAVKQFTLEAEGAYLAAHGSLMLDSEGFPEGVLEAEVANPGALAALLGKIGAISADEAKQAQANLTLAVLAGGGKLSGLLVLKNGELSFAGARLARLSRIAPAPVQP
ncbi:MAG TPA: DUF2125 domain-containing protein [Parvularculaceae bacterium]|nr:DUF2125 domain-containing protein [Parvularculaceae bacterium]